MPNDILTSIVKTDCAESFNPPSLDIPLWPNPLISFFQAHPAPLRFWQYFLYISPKSNVGQTQNKLMSQSYFFIFRRLQNIATLLFLLKTSNARLRFDSK